jgi:hypothetical protein
MLSPRTPLLAALAVPIALALGAPAAGAATLPKLNLSPTGVSGFGAGYTFPVGKSCGSIVGVEGQGPSGGIDSTVCGYGLTFVGPLVSVTNVIGPTIISPGFAGTVVVAGGNVAGSG